MKLKINNAEFIKGAVEPNQYPNFSIPEFAFFGRSNVGKSSLINMIVNRKNLVKTGSKPGKTREINFFLINRCTKGTVTSLKDIAHSSQKDLLCFTDLPGYGYAKLSGKSIQDIDKMLYEYCSLRKSLSGLFFLMDIRRNPGEIEKNTIDFFDDLGINTLIILTKADKLSKNLQINKTNEIMKFFNCSKEHIILSSTLKKTGKDKILNAISEKLNS